MTDHVVLHGLLRRTRSRLEDDVQHFYGLVPGDDCRPLAASISRTPGDVSLPSSGPYAWAIAALDETSIGAAVAASPSANADLRPISSMVLSLKFNHALRSGEEASETSARLIVNEANEPHTDMSPPR